VRYAFRRIGYSLVLLLGVSLLSFLLASMAPGDYFSTLRADPNITPRTISVLRSQYGLDQPLPLRYLQWLASIVHGDWGYSFAYNSPAAPLLWSRTQNTLLLSATAAFLAWSISLPFGIWSVARSSRFRTALASIVISLLLAIPEIVIGLLLLLFAARTRLLPIGGIISADERSGIAVHLVLPVTCLVLTSIPLLVSHTRSSMTDVLNSSFLTAARSYGISPLRLLYRHALPAAANQLISLFGFSLGLLLSSSLLIEVLFGWPGLGSLLFEAILARDLFLVLDAALLGSIFLVSGNLLADLLLYTVDPRIRFG
jgi:peptide/nickel transport system permease protein